MLPKKNRIPRKLFPDILTSRLYAHSNGFSVRFSPADEITRVAVSVSKKVAKSAAERNKIRRRTYSVLRLTLPDMRNGLYLFSARSGASALAGEKIAVEIHGLLRTVGAFVSKEKKG
jgi:ribonuclease P protein component